MKKPPFLELTVRFADTDAAAIVYFGNYPSYFDESFIHVIRSLDITWDVYKEYGFMAPIVEQKATYHSPLKVGEKIRIYVTILKISNRSFTSHHFITVEREEGLVIVASGYITRVTVDLEEFKAIAIPKFYRERLEKFAMSEEEWEAFKNKIRENSVQVF